MNAALKELEEANDQLKKAPPRAAFARVDVKRRQDDIVAEYHAAKDAAEALEPELQQMKTAKGDEAAAEVVELKARMQSLRLEENALFNLAQENALPGFE